MRVAKLIDAIFNFRRLDASVTTSGQPSEEQIGALADAGVTTVINLGLHDHERALPDEAASVAAAGMRYVHIPVPFDAPDENHYREFTDAMLATQGEPVHVHCIMNMRVTAFVYRWLQDRGASETEARRLMDSVWQPGGPWAAFIGDVERIDQPHLGPKN
ncbi:Beta-lactamase hydrolase-like protein phosphatase-like domain-containing protein [Sphingomonas antarctica]|uniref:protein tyrosine phosphatase family protein n=1 Tax=Sphingomonas antarctica TaxID=2040274 RepID=UPI0039E88556